MTAPAALVHRTPKQLLDTPSSLGDPMTSSPNLDPFEGLSEEEIAKRSSEVPPGVATPGADAAPAAPAAAAPADNAMMILAGRSLDIDQQRSATASSAPSRKSV